MEIIKNLNWRYATKKFDRTRKINGDELDQIMKAVSLSASSFGLQAYKILVVENPEIRKKLRAVSYDQPQITDSSHLFVFCNYTAVNVPTIDEFIQLNANIKNLKVEDLSQYGDFLKGSMAQRSSEQINIWTSKQTYIALSTLLAATSELKIDACPMEGFDTEQYNNILGLKEKGLNASVIAAVGYRSPDDVTQLAPKVRKPIELLFEKV